MKPKNILKWRTLPFVYLQDFWDEWLAKLPARSFCLLRTPIVVHHGALGFISRQPYLPDGLMRQNRHPVGVLKDYCWPVDKKTARERLNWPDDRIGEFRVTQQKNI